MKLIQWFHFMADQIMISKLLRRHGYSINIYTLMNSILTPNEVNCNSKETVSILCIIDCSDEIH